ncbi:TetR/AcrR family transcriptional regulator [Gynuella sp.]|uniref:TetR/AcrR family transcriptional regulator n=1 Tax=Gynuella sp. TaxID=2969146 RepID=UPI003D11EC68
MRKSTQKRAIETRDKLINIAVEMIRTNGYEALRVEELVAQAGVAKGTFFAHFKDKDSLMDLLIGNEIDHYLDQLERAATPKDVSDMTDQLLPLLHFMSSERYVFDVILRRSGAAAIEEIGPIATTFGRFEEVMGQWLSGGHFRTDVPLHILVEGIEALLMQTLALNFCALHNNLPLKERFYPYLKAWLTPQI